MIIIKGISILLLMFIFGLFIEVQAEPVKSFKNKALLANTIKFDESEGVMKTTIKPVSDWGGSGKKSSFSESGQSFLKTPQNKIKEFKNRGGLPSLTLLKSNKAELFMIFRFSFAPKEGHLFLEMNL